MGSDILKQVTASATERSTSKNSFSNASFDNVLCHITRKLGPGQTFQKNTLGTRDQESYSNF